MLRGMTGPHPAPPGRAQQAQTHLLALIRDQHLPPGTPLPSEGQLSAQLGISRGMIREAYRALAARGVVSVANGRAPRVAAPDPAPLTEVLDHALLGQAASATQILEVRRALELQVAAQAAAHRTGAQAAALRASVSAMQAAGPGTDAFIEHDLHFHTLLAGATGNPLHGVLVGALHALLARSIRSGLPHYADPAHFGALVDVHDRLARAVERRDPQAAAEITREHFALAELAVSLAEQRQPE
ncbi:FadR family transcriptional regulator [Deinococcus sp. JMULE3]|nr:FadR family transcriptional regulator [Deinococcus sp. JMULE3]